MTKQDIHTQFVQHFAVEPKVSVKSPGRINIIGEHTDYNDGFVLPTAIDKAVYVAVSERDDDLIKLYAEDFKAFYESSLSSLAPTDAGWPNYILGVVNQFVEQGLPVRGFNLYIDGDVPLGAGLSSSAAVECATGFALNVLFDLKLDRVALAKIGQLAEHTFAGVKCGIMDQFASILSKANHVVRLDCRDLSYSYEPLELGDYTLLLLNSNVKHSLASSAYNDRREACEQGVAWIQEKYPAVKSLRDAEQSMLTEILLPKDETVYRKCKYVVEEVQRVQDACAALHVGDLEEVGRLMYLTHAGLQHDYQVSCPEIDFLVEYVSHFPEVLGARMMGGGFGGCTINIVHQSFVDLLIQRIAPAYKEKFNKDLEPIHVVPSNGTELLT